MIGSIIVGAIIRSLDKVFKDIEKRDERVREERESRKQLRSLPEYQCLITEKIGEFLEKIKKVMRNRG